MAVRITFNSDELLRIENEEESSLTLRKHGKKGQLLSVLVEKYDREEGIGSELLAAGEKLSRSMGMESIEANYPDSIEGMTGFLENAGYEVSPVASAVAIDISSLLSSVAIKKLLARNTENATFVPFLQLINEGGGSLLSIMSKYKLSLSSSDVARFHKKISGAVYDTTGEPKAFLLCSKEKESLVVELFAGIGEDNPLYFTSAIQGMLRGIIEDGGEETFQYLSMIIANEKIDAFLDRYIRKELTRIPITNIMFAKKTLSDAEMTGTETEEELDEDKEEIWEREVRKVPLMSNTIFKMSWLNSVSSAEDIFTYLKFVLEELYDEKVFSRDAVTIREFGGLEFVNARPEKSIKSLDELTREQFQNGLSACQLPWAKGRIEKMLQQRGKGLEARASCCIISEGTVKGMFLVKKLDTGELVPDTIFGSEGSEKEDVIDMLRYFVRAVMVRYGKDQRVILKGDGRTEER